jgi:type I restriction enzyme S subunit
MTPSKGNAAFWGDGISWASSQDIKSARLSRTTHSITQRALDETRLTVCPIGSVLVVVRSGILSHTLPVTITDIPVVINQDLKAFDSGDRVLNEWLAAWLRASERDILGENRRDGTTVQSVQYSLLKERLLPVPPRDEQLKLLARLGEIDARRASIADRLAATRAIVDRLHTAVLAAACAGRLTADWREEHATLAAPDLTLAAERRRSDARQATAASINPHASPRELPGSWRLAPLGLLLTDLQYGTSKRSAYDTDGTPVLRIPNLSGGILRTDDLKFADLGPREAAALSLRIGDLLMIRSNGSVGLVGLAAAVTEQAVGMAYAGYLIRLRTDAEFLLPSYLRLALASPDVRRQIELPARSTSGVHNINSSEVRSLAVPLPPIDEQHEIVRVATAATAVADRLVGTISAAERTIDSAARAGFAQAFRCELAPAVDT